jgi:hypothetical protein
MTQSPSAVPAGAAEAGSRPSPGARILAQWLRIHALGAAQARTHRDCVAAMTQCGLVVTQRSVFELEAELVHAGEPVGSCDRGIYMCRDEDDFRLAYHYIACRFAPMKARAEALERMRAERFGGTPRLF